jgi:hypothetical protein
MSAPLRPLFPPRNSRLTAHHIASLQTPVTNTLHPFQKPPSRKTRPSSPLLPSSSAFANIRFALSRGQQTNSLGPSLDSHHLAGQTRCLGARRLLFPFADVRKRCFSVSASRSFFQAASPLKLSYSIDDSTAKQQLFHSHPSIPRSNHPSCASASPTLQPHSTTNADIENMSLDCWLQSTVYFQQTLWERDESRRPPPLVSQPG